jgi:hypothetical protein
MIPHGKYLSGSNFEWIKLHRGDIERFMQRKINLDSYEDFLKFDEYGYICGGMVMKHLGEFRIIVEDYARRLNSKIKELMSYLIFGKSKIMYIVGARDSGKTCFSFWLAEKIHEQRPKMGIAYVGIRINKEALPKWCKNFDSINDVPNGWLIILDELAVSYNARDHASVENKTLGQLLAIARHKDLSVLAITQDPNMGEINVWRLKDMVVYKMSNTYELPSRDSKNTRGASKILMFWAFIRNWMKPRRQEEALFEYQAKERIMLFEYDLPKCWTESLSKAFKFVDFKPKEDIKIIAKPLKSNAEVLYI